MLIVVAWKQFVLFGNFFKSYFLKSCDSIYYECTMY